jgi:putative flippase GtrA
MRRFLQQLMRFGIVGLSAMTVHLAVISLLVPLGITPLLANAPAFIVAFQVSYFGHRHWTFWDQANDSSSYLKLLVVSLSSFAANEGLYAILLHMGFGYRAGLAVVLVLVSAITFLASRLWVFRSAPLPD